MIIPRIYEPNEEEILYHYCDANAFHAICMNKKIRFSDLFSMNDFMEMHWGYHKVWEETATELINEIEKEFLDEIDNIIHVSGIKGLLVASCYSLQGHVLSQWRAYANDGKGYAIGFKAKDLINMAVRPLKILYNHREQVEELKKIIKALKKVEESEKNKFSKDFREACFTLAFDLAAYKNPAFIEEQEVRLVHILDFKESNNFLKLTDSGGHAFGRDVDGAPVLFYMRENIPVAFIEQDFSNSGSLNPIKEIIIGPKNDVLPSTISVFLETLGIGNVNIKKSMASYR